MDMKQIVNHEELAWLKDIENSLKQFPIYLTSRHWIHGTNFHYQPGLEIHITHEGEGTMVIGRQVLLQSPRTVLVFRGKVPHQMFSRSSYKRTVVCIHFIEDDNTVLSSLHRLVDFGWIPDDSCLSFSLNPKQFQLVEEMCNTLREELAARQVGWDRQALAQVLQMTVFLQRSAAEQERAVEASAQLSGKKNDLVQLCSDYVCKNLDGDLSLKTVSRRFAVSEEYLTRSFTKEMGISFYQYVLLQRVAEGRRLLGEAPDVSIADIACMIGFPSHSHFSRHFKMLTEQTPSTYRKKLLGREKA
jgi:AraC-like DNA-binding protein